jgi:formate dehydrogenase gamma subunit
MKHHTLRVTGGLVALAVLGGPGAVGAPPAPPEPSVRPAGVCPPFHLRDEQGGKIDPVAGVNARVPYSPRQTCGAAGCHDYDTITRGYHFTQGQGEEPTADQRARYAWASSPGNFGGNWCSPAPLYRFLSPKDNESAARMDMTAFDFFAAPCGTCHPGGGSAEHDRSGKRYDTWMADPASGFSPGAENRFDGDYHKARWSETGVLEADCLLCHQPGYDHGERQAQLGAWNFLWAATAGAGLAAVTGSVKEGKPVEVAYDLARFSSDGTLKLSFVRQPRNEACLSCHAQPGWKKRGANYRARTDVHLRAGLKCVDCHPAGSSARDPRISGREEHQIAKGDDPGGLVRNDLDDTVVGCADCHGSGRHGAPVARHAQLPALHLERIACQTCHVPERLVMPAEVQASDVFNEAPWIHSAGKKLWTFYGPDRRARNHYGFLEVMGYDDKPSEPFRPTLFRYKGKIYPGNRIHSAWPGLEIEGQEALAQPRMSDVARMWRAHRADPAKYPALAEIRDDTGDGVPEVNRPEEIDALVASVRQALEDVGYPLEGARVVWVSNDRVYRSGTEYREVPKHGWEASPFANVHKYSHDVYPARSALGSGGCTDCHAPGSPFLYASVLRTPFGPDGRPGTVPQWELLGMTRSGAALGAWRESTLKPAGPWLLGTVLALCLLHLVVFGPRRTADRPGEPAVVRYRPAERVAHAVAMGSFLVLAVTGLSFLLGAQSPLGLAARRFHALTGFVFAASVLAIVAFWLREARPEPGDRDWLRHVGGYLGFRGHLPAGRLNAGQKLYFWFVAAAGLALTLTGLLMYWPGLLPSALSFAYTLHDLLAVLALCGVAAHFYLAVVVNPGALRGILEGTVGASWAREHHPGWKAAAAGAAPEREGR